MTSDDVARTQRVNYIEDLNTGFSKELGRCMEWKRWRSSGWVACRLQEIKVQYYCMVNGDESFILHFSSNGIQNFFLKYKFQLD